MKTGKSIEQIREDGINALSQKLGPDGMIRFIQQFDFCRGDYTEDRHTMLDNYTIDDIVGEIKKKCFF